MVKRGLDSQLDRELEDMGPTRMSRELTRIQPGLIQSA